MALVALAGPVASQEPGTAEEPVDLIEGVGGAFVFSERPAELAEWYREVLGLEFEGSEEAGAFYQIFWFRDADRPERPVDVTFAIMRSRVPLEREVPVEEPESMYGDQPFMVNLRVTDIERVEARLDSLGVEILKRQDEPYGSFLWIRDADGNRLELYEAQPPPSPDEEPAAPPEEP